MSTKNLTFDYSKYDEQLYNHIHDNTGKLCLILGPMFSGKTTTLIDIYNYYLEYKHTITNDVIAINHSTDTRYTSEPLLYSHNKSYIPCIKLDSLNQPDILAYLCSYKIILINEGQFFEDLEQAVRFLVNANKKVYIAALDGDFQQKPFVNISNVIAFADYYKKLYSNCKCGNLAPFSARLTKETEQIVVGSDNYVPICRQCLKDTLLIQCHKVEIHPAIFNIT